MRRARAWLERWRRKPRRTLLRWDLERFALTPPSVVALCGIGAWRLLAVDAPRFSGSARLAAVGGGVAFVAVGVATAYGIVLYLRRPVLDEPQLKPAPVSGDETARAESERRAWRSR